MKIKGIVDEDFTNYKKPSMFIIMPTCSFKCDKECGKPVCQNSELAAVPVIDINPVELANRFYNNPITEAIVFGGLEPFDSFGDMCEFLSIVTSLYNVCYDIKTPPDIVIYTGYYPYEIKDKLHTLKTYLSDGIDNIIVKFGRFVPDDYPIFDGELGVKLASMNQVTYAEVIT